MKEDATSILKGLNQKRSSWLEATRENKFEDGILRLLSDLYPDQAHFIFELLQNAEDAGASLVQFQLTKDMLLVRHDGRRLFDSRDVDSITSIGQSTKKEDVNQIGKFGIGFKAVFAYSKTPQVHSGEYNFEIRDLVCPFQIPGIQKSKQETVFVLPFNNASKSAESCFREIKTVFESLDHTILLFLNNIESIEWDLNGEESGLAVREHITDTDEELVKVSITNTSNTDLQEDAWFLRFQGVLEEHGNLKCSIALKLGFRKDNQSDLDARKGLSEQMKVVPADGQLCVFFPAEKETTGLKIYVNGPYAATIDRASIRHDHEDNRAIFKSTAQLLVEAMEHLKETGLLTPEFLGVLPNDEDQLSPFYAVLRETVYNALRNRVLIPCLDGGYGKAEELARGPKVVTDVIGDNALAVLFDDDKKQWAAGVMQNSRSDKLLASLGMPYWGYEELIDAVEEKYRSWWPDDDALGWLQEQRDGWLQSFYLLLLTAAKREDREHDISEWKIIKAQDGELFVGGDVYFPIEGDPLATELPTVAAKIFDGLKKERQKRLQEFLDAAGVKQIGEREELQKILDRFYAENAEAPGNKKHLEHIRRFIRWSEEGNGAGAFRSYYIFKDSTEEYFCQGVQCYIDKPFEETGLGSIYSDGTGRDESRSALWSGYTRVKNFIRFAEACGARKVLEIEQRGVWSNPRSSELYAGTGGSRSTHTGINEDYYIESLEELLEENNVGVARLVWRTLAGVEPRVLKARYRPNQQYSIRSVPSSLVQTLQSTKWIPGKDGKYYLPKEISQKSLRDDFEYDDRNGWLTAVGFAEEEQKATKEYRQRKEIAKQLGITLQDIDFLKILKESPEKYKKIKRQVEELLAPTEFPERPSIDPERRTQRAKGRAGEAAEKKYEGRNRSVRVSGPAGDNVTYLEQNYTNDKEQLVCQICENEMPFRRRDGRYYFEAVQLLDDLAKEHVAAYVALCPLCAAKFKELVKRDEKQRQRLREDIVNSEELRMELELGKESGSIRFVEKHLLDIRGFLVEEDEQLGTESSSR